MGGVVWGFSACGLSARQGANSLSRARWERAPWFCLKNILQQFGLGRGPVDDLSQRLAEGVERLQRPGFAPESVSDRLLDAGIEERRVGGSGRG